MSEHLLSSEGFAAFTDINSLIPQGYREMSTTDPSFRGREKLANLGVPRRKIPTLWGHWRPLGGADHVLSGHTTGPPKAKTLCWPAAVGGAGTIVSLPTPSVR